MSLPFLPGNTFEKSLGKQKFHKSHHFDYNNEVAMSVGECKPGIGGDVRSDQKFAAEFSTMPRGNGTDMPAWVAFDRQVLAFDAYFQECVHEKREEQFRIRTVKIYFYLEDDSIQVIEPRLKNAGLPQGTLIKRHRIPRPVPNDNLFYKAEDFDIGNEVELYGRVFKIVDCDEFTRNFTGKIGVLQKPRIQIPEDPYTDHRKAITETAQPLRPYERVDSLKQFLDHDRHVLRFFCVWDDTDEMFGDTREMVLHYFLADDTIEIREAITVNSGRDATPMFLHRGKLPKGTEKLAKPGEKTARTVLNVFGPMGHGGRYILDSLKTGARDQDFYTDADIAIGSVLNIWGRRFLICDCDDFTKEYYHTKFGITDFKPIESRAKPAVRTQKEVPPYNGFGSEEDSLCSTKGLLPKPPKGDFLKFMEKDRYGLESNVLRFLAIMPTLNNIDKERKFIISFFLSDDTLLIYEPIVRNSGIIGGKFLERGRVIKTPPTGYVRFNTELSTYYNAIDFFIGSEVKINEHKFVIVDADEYAYQYMEDHRNEYPVADCAKILSRIREQLGDKKCDLEKRTDLPEIIDYIQLHSIISSFVDNNISNHELATIARAYMNCGDNSLNLDTLVAVAQEQLKKQNFEDLSKITNQLLHYDRERKDLVNVESVRLTFMSLRVPIVIDLLKAILEIYPKENGFIRYREFVDIFDWRKNPARSIPQKKTTRPDEFWIKKSGKCVGGINLAAIVQNICQG